MIKRNVYIQTRSAAFNFYDDSFGMNGTTAYQQLKNGQAIHALSESSEDNSEIFIPYESILRGTVSVIADSTEKADPYGCEVGSTTAGPSSGFTIPGFVPSKEV